MSPPTLPRGAYPLTRAQGIAAAVFVALVALGLALIVPALARAGNILALPPDAVRFGAASLVPPLPKSPTALGWRVTSATTDSVTLKKGGVTVTAHSGVTSADLADQIQSALDTYPRDGMSGPGEDPRVLGPTQFHSATTGTDGYIGWLEGDRASAVIAVIPMLRGIDDSLSTRYVEVVAHGPAKEMERYGTEIEAMLDSVRFSLTGSP